MATAKRMLHLLLREPKQKSPELRLMATLWILRRLPQKLNVKQKRRRKRTGKGKARTEMLLLDLKQKRRKRVLRHIRRAMSWRMAAAKRVLHLLLRESRSTELRSMVTPWIFRRLPQKLNVKLKRRRKRTRKGRTVMLLLDLKQKRRKRTRKGRTVMLLQMLTQDCAAEDVEPEVFTKGKKKKKTQD